MSGETKTHRIWRRFVARQIEQFRNAVLGANLEAVQMAGPSIGGSLAFAVEDRATFSTGLIRGKVKLRGPFAPDAVTLFLNLRVADGSHVGFVQAEEGGVCVVPAGGEFDALLGDGFLYVAATLTAERLRDEAARQRISMDPALLVAPGVYPAPRAAPAIVRLRSEFSELHAEEPLHGRSEAALSAEALRAMIAGLAQGPSTNRALPGSSAQIVARAEDFLFDRLPEAPSIEAMAQGAQTSPATLQRAFREVLNEAPQDYLTRLRLHGLRRFLLAGIGSHSISTLVRLCGFGAEDSLKVSASYRALFGESPSATRAAGRAHRHGAQLF